MLSPWFVSIVALSYLGLLFGVAFYGDRRVPRWRGGGRESVIYALSLAIYCTSWTFYGSVGRAASHGLDFILIYVGPILVMLPGYPIMRKILRIARAHNVTSIADFIGARYGKSRPVAALATVIAVVGVLPYIALQLQAVTLSFDALVSVSLDPTQSEHGLPLWRDTALYVALMMAGFSILFGVRHVHASERHHGLILAIAFESLVKLGAFLAVGVFVVYELFDGPTQLTREAMADPRLAPLLEAIEFQPAWLSITLLAAFAFICLPRQFHVAVVESGRPANLRMAAWLFPVYLVAINLFVPAIAAAGLLRLAGGTPSDLFVLMLPVANNESLLSLAVFIGGLSASTSMVIIESVALSTMICNELVMPVLLQQRALRAATGGAMVGLLLAIRRSAIFIVLIAAYGYHVLIGDRYPLASIGLISFCAVAQFAPALFAGLYWRGAHRMGTLAGMAGGTLVWAYALLLPSLSEAGWLPPAGILGGGSLPAMLAGPDPLTNGAVWSLLVNVVLFIGGSLLARQHLQDRQQAEAFIAGEPRVDPADPDGGRAPAFDDLKNLAARFLGRERAEHAFAGPIADFREENLAAFTERLLSGAIGAASARIVVAAVLHRRWTSMRSTRAMLDEASEAILFNRDLLRATLENVSQGIGMFDPGVRLAAWNQRFLELLAIPEELAQVGTSLAAIVESPERCRSPTAVDLSALCETQADPMRSAEPHTYERRRSDGRVLELQTNPMPAGGFVLVCTDITDRRRAEESLQRAQAELSRVARLTTVGELGASLAHQINQPLAAIVASSNASLRWLDSAQNFGRARESIGRIIADANRASEIISRIRTLTMNKPPERVRLDMNEIIEEVLAFTQIELPARHVSVSKQLEATLPPVMGDRSQLQQVLLNLIMNALEAMSTVTDRRRELTVVSHLAEDGALLVTVRDTGPSLDPSPAGRIFDAFFMTRGNGTGMGLSISTSIVEAHGGRLWASSIEPYGAAFHFSLPAAVEDNP